MNTVSVQIDITTPTGRRLLREVEKYPKVAKIEHVLPEAIAGQKWHTIEEVFSEVEKELNEHYGTNYKLKY